MIVPMKKYDIVVFHREKEEFLERLQDLGLVDITTTGWEPDECERERIILIDRMKAAVTKLREIASEDDYQPSEPIGDGCEAFECYTSAANAVDSVNARITQAEKELGELQVWGEFDPAKLDALRGQGVSLHFFSAYTKEFEAAREQWEQQYTIFPVSDVDGFTYFVVITAPDTEVAINAQQLKPLTVSVKDKQLEIAALGKEKQRWTDQLQKCASSADAIERQMEVEKEKLHISQVSDSGVEAAEGTLVVMEGWATKETALNVDRMLEQYPGVFYVKADPTPDDDTPTLLKNNRFNKLFEFIGNFYSLPKYGTMDLTSAFGPFYVLFFGMCLGDAGYGLLYLIGGIVMLQKLKPSLHGVARLVILCGISTVICGGFMGSFFGIEYAAYEPFARVRSYILSTDNLFVLALAIGMFQILFGMVLKVIMYTKSYGFKYALATLGWIIVIVSSLAAYFLPELGVEGFSMSSIPYYACLGIGAFMMLFLNSPGKNPFLNLGAGLWNTYNDVTGLLSDVLSYIRLFAIGLSGGILALVFNQLALGLSPEIPVVRQVSIVLILLIGHGINLFMSSLSAFVHPMRLTFVEFYKNAGFETTMREFTPLKRSQKTTNNN